MGSEKTRDQVVRPFPWIFMCGAHYGTEINIVRRFPPAFWLSKHDFSSSIGILAECQDELGAWLNLRSYRPPSFVEVRPCNKSCCLPQAFISTDTIGSKLCPEHRGEVIWPLLVFFQTCFSWPVISWLWWIRHWSQSEITDSGSGVEFCGDATVRQNMLATVAAYFTDPTGSKPCPEL